MFLFVAALIPDCLAQSTDAPQSSTKSSYKEAVQRALEIPANQGGIFAQPSTPRVPTAKLTSSAKTLSGKASDDLLENDSLLDSDSDAADPLMSMGPDQPMRQMLPGALHGKAASKPLTSQADGKDPHADLFIDDCYPSAIKCAPCHQKIYDEWRVSAHAYAAVSPMYNKFEQAMADLTKGTVGTFCARCHAPVATQINYPREASILDGPHVLREGVTCIACHRVKEQYGKVHGERRIEPGNLQDPVYGGIGGDGVAKAIQNADTYKIKLDPNNKKPGQVIHLQGIQFEQLSRSDFCYSCHQVHVHPGIGLEVVWAQYRAGPACKKGIRCQDCHMGRVPGKAEGFEYGPAAIVGGKPVVENRRHSNHLFHGPITPIAHPGIFPHNEKSLDWSPQQWINFDWRAGWGTEQFEKVIAQRPQAFQFPAPWDSADERRDARKIIDDNLKLLAIKRQSSIATMEAGGHIDGPYFTSRRARGQDLNFKYVVKNVSEGHNMPSGSLGAQPQLWLNVALIGPRGQRIWESGYLDANGDLANLHSHQVQQGIIPPDRQLFNLQTQFLITGVKGPDREMALPVNIDFDQLPFLRPGAQPITVLNHPPFIRMEAHSIPPLGEKIAKYSVPGELLCEPGVYRLSVRLRSRMEPIYFMDLVNATPDMKRRMIEATLDLHQYSVQFEIR